MAKKKVTKRTKKAKPTYAAQLRLLADSWEANVKTLSLERFKGALEELQAWWEYEGVDGSDDDVQDAFDAWLATATVSVVADRLYVESQYQNAVFVDGMWVWEDEAGE